MKESDTLVFPQARVLKSDPRETECQDPDSFAIIQTTMVFPNKEKGLSQMTLIHRLSTVWGACC